jgi:hypothetical protein
MSNETQNRQADAKLDAAIAEKNKAVADYAVAKAAADEAQSKAGKLATILNQKKVEFERLVQLKHPYMATATGSAAAAK